jgi:hypothetical protein
MGVNDAKLLHATLKLYNHRMQLTATDTKICRDHNAVIYD